MIPGTRESFPSITDYDLSAAPWMKSPKNRVSGAVFSKVVNAWWESLARLRVWSHFFLYLNVEGVDATLLKTNWVMVSTVLEACALENHEWILNQHYHWYMREQVKLIRGLCTKTFAFHSLYPGDVRKDFHMVTTLAAVTAVVFLGTLGTVFCMCSTLPYCFVLKIRAYIPLSMYNPMKRDPRTIS